LVNGGQFVLKYLVEIVDNLRVTLHFLSSKFA
jgi:hypothetical protein